MRDEPGTTTQAKLLTHSRRETLLFHAAPYLALLGALALFVGSLQTWVTLHVVITGHSGVFTIDSAITGWAGLLDVIDETPFIVLARLTFLLWDILPLASLLLCLLIVRQQRLASRLLAIYGAWLLLATVIVALALVHAGAMDYPLVCAPEAIFCPKVSVASRSIEVGGWLTLGSLALSWLALALLVQRRRGTIVAMGLQAIAPARYSPSHRLGAVVFTLGAALWAFGLFAVPWATSGCTGLHLSFNHFVRGACSGVDGYDVLTSGLAAFRQPGAASWPLIQMAGIIGLYVVVTVWLPRLKRATWITACIWGLLAALLFIVGFIGVQATIANPPVFTSDPHDPWVGSYGVAICALGIVACLTGTALLGWGEMTQARRA